MHTRSNYPPSICKKLPASVNLRLATIPSTQDIFSQHTKENQEALEKSGHHHKLTFSEIATLHSTWNKSKRYIIFWYISLYLKMLPSV